MGRFALSKTDDWQLVHPQQDIRGWPVQDAAGARVGTVTELIANTDSERVESVVLDTGTELPARDIELGDGVVRVHDGAAATDAGPVVKTYHDDAHVRRRADTGDGAARAGGAASTADYGAHADAFEQHYHTTFAGAGEPFAFYEPAYRHGYTHGASADHRGTDYAALEPDLRRSYEREHGEGTFEKVKDAVRHAFDRARRS